MDEQQLEKRRETGRRYYERHKDEVRKRKREQMYRRRHGADRPEVLRREARRRAHNRKRAAAARAAGAVKRCGRCGETKPVTGFHVDGTRADGFRAQCRTCISTLGRAQRAQREPRGYRRVAEAGIGRKLASREHVHHVNFVPTDNRAENLWVCTGSRHRKAEASLFTLIAPLLERGVILFDREAGEYRLGRSSG